MTELVLVAALALLGVGSASAEVIIVNTSCGKTAYLDSNRGTAAQLLEQAKDIDVVLCHSLSGGSDKPKLEKACKEENFKKVTS